MLDTLEKQSNVRLLGAGEFTDPTDRELQADLPDGFRETQVIFREVMSDQGLATFYDIDEPTLSFNGSYTNIWDFVRNVALNGYERNWPDEPEATPLGIRVTHPSFIVLAIREGTAWTFHDTLPAIQLKDPVQYPDRYGYLHYVRPDGSTSPTPIAGCRMVFFAAMPVLGVKPNYYIQKLSYYVQDGYGTEQIIDPDVRHPGGGNS